MMARLTPMPWIRHPKFPFSLPLRKSWGESLSWLTIPYPKSVPTSKSPSSITSPLLAPQNPKADYLSLKCTPTLLLKLLDNWTYFLSA